MQGTRVTKVMGAGIAALAAMFALWGVLFAAQPAYAANADDLAAGDAAVSTASQTPELAVVADNAEVRVGEIIEITASNNVEGQTGTWVWEPVKSSKYIKLSKTNQPTVRVKGLKGGNAKLKVTYITDDHAKKSSVTIKVKVKGIKNKLAAANGIVYKRTGIDTVRVQSTKGNKDLGLKTIKIGKTIKLGDTEGCEATYKITAIKAGSLNNQKKTTKIVVGDNVKTIGAHAFSNDPKLKTLIIGKGVTKLYNFARTSTKALKTVTIKSTKLKKASVKSCLKGNKSVKTIKVPASKVKAYKKIFTKANCGKKVTVKK